MPSLFTVSNPATAFQWWFVVFIYVLPFMLYASWAALSLLDLDARADVGEPGAPAWVVAVLLLPLVGAAAYLLGSSRHLRGASKFAIVFGGLIVWLVPLTVGLVLAGGPLGPKALS